MIRDILENEERIMEFKTEEILRDDNIISLENGDWAYRHLLAEYGKEDSFFVLGTIYPRYGEEIPLYREAKWSNSLSEAMTFYNKLCDIFSCQPID